MVIGFEFYKTAPNMGLPQAGLDKLTSAFYRCCALAMGLDRFIIGFLF